MRFLSRQDAGEQLGRHLLNADVKVDVVLGVPRGGMLVAEPVARWLESPLDVVVAREMRHPLHPTLAVGALAECGVVVAAGRMTADELSDAQTAELIREEEKRLDQYALLFAGRRRFNLADACALIVDDGLASAATVLAAVMSVRRRGAAEVFFAAPVACLQALAELKPAVEGVTVLVADPEFEAVERYYDSFPQATDEEVLAVLKNAGAPA